MTPDANFYVIGGNKIWQKKAKRGSTGNADEEEPPKLQIENADRTHI